MQILTEDGLSDYGAILDDNTRLETLDKHTEYVNHLQCRNTLSAFTDCTRLPSLEALLLSYPMTRLQMLQASQDACRRAISQGRHR